MRKALFHLHTKYSFDSMTPPSRIVQECVENGINYLVISDHDSLKGSLQAKEFAGKGKLPIEIPISAEYYTDVGDIIVVGVPSDFQKITDYRELCRAVKSCGGYTVLPHPFDQHKLERIDFSLIDCIEVFNSRSTVENNKHALELALELDKPWIFGSDAHVLKNVFNCLFLYTGRNPFEGQVFPLQLAYTSLFCKNLSQLTKALKTREPRLAVRTIKKMVKGLF